MGERLDPPIVGKGGRQLAGEDELSKGGKVPIAAFANGVGEGIGMGAERKLSTGRLKSKCREQAPSVRDEEQLLGRAIEEEYDKIAAEALKGVDARIGVEPGNESAGKAPVSCDLGSGIPLFLVEGNATRERNEHGVIGSDKRSPDCPIISRAEK